MTKKYDKYFFETNEYQDAINDLEGFIFENEQDFLKTFCFDSEGLIRISVSSESIYYTYVLPSGQHIGDSKPLDEITWWVRQLEEKE